MKLCQYQGNGVCINCAQIPPEGYGDICRRLAEILLDCFEEIAKTEWTYEQEQIFADFGVVKEVRE